ncbi:MAG: DUF4079 family protein, partial [Cyanobacteria bacterium J06576_12]
MNSETFEAIKPWLNFIHPLLMWGILALTLYAGYLGYQHRQTRLATGEEKKALRKSFDKIKAGSFDENRSELER